MSKTKRKPQVFLVRQRNRILCVFADIENAQAFIEAAGLQSKAEIVARTLWYGQPHYPGFNL